MKSLARSLVLFTLCILLVLPNAQGIQAQEGNSRYYSETGHKVSGDFWQFYRNQPNAEQIFGYPITEAFTDIRSGRQIQYFTYARFEFRPENPVGKRVHLSPLGEYLYEKGRKLEIYAPVGCRPFPNGMAICYDFLDFYEKNGGQSVFGDPISGFEYLNNRIVQHFQNARFEWHPNNPPGAKVKLSELGRVYFSYVGEDVGLLAPVKNIDIVPSILSIKARAFAWKAVTRPTDVQTVYVTVQDQTLSPVKNAIVVATIYFPSGSPRSVTLNTNANGIVIIPFEIANQPPGSLVLVEVEVLFEGLSSKAVTSFRIWK